jgi:hypothetical protein
MSHYFIHFGCWNKGRCPENNDLTRVLSKINSLTEKPQFLSICGDNYYPFKEAKKKYLILEELLSGFKCLPSDIPIYMTYGNHDFETNLYINDVLEQSCTLTKTEIDIVNQEFQNIHLRLFQSTFFGANTKLLFLDTTIYNDNDIAEYEQCYKEVDGKYNSSNDVKQDQLEFIRSFVDSIDSSITNLIIIGHHPIANYKYKKEKMFFLTLNSDFNDILFNIIYSPLKEKGINLNYFYLCADLHQYQPGNIVINDEMRIKQYIVGTGGAEKDQIIKALIPREPSTLGNLQYSMNDEDLAKSDMKNGFLKCTANGPELVFEFVEVTLDVGVGGKRKTKKRRKVNKKTRKNKKLKRKS